MDLSDLVYQQVPPCDYPLDEVFTWEIPDAAVFAQNSANPERLDTTTLDKSKLGPWAQTLTNSMTYSATGQTFSSEVSFSIEITDPCITTELIQFTPDVLTVVNGEEASITFTEVTDSVEVGKNIDTLCGAREYAVYANDETTPAEWVALAGGPEEYTVTATPDLTPGFEGPYPFKLRTALTLYPEHAVMWTALSVVVTAADCD